MLLALRVKGKQVTQAFGIWPPPLLCWLLSLEADLSPDALVSTQNPCCFRASIVPVNIVLPEVFLFLQVASADAEAQPM